METLFCRILFIYVMPGEGDDDDKSYIFRENDVFSLVRTSRRVRNSQLL